ncbi:MAG TPA: DMT family transporter [Actinomycetota bacterium]|nr:DMT family transporter [Actinomycetota bacterium]
MGEVALPVANQESPEPRDSGPRILGLPRSRFFGYLFGLLTATCWATSPIFIRRGLAGLDSPLWGTTIGLTVAAAGFMAWVGWTSRGAIDRPRPRHGGVRLAVFLMAVGGLASGIGALARTTAIDLVAVVIAVPLLQTTSLWTMTFSTLIFGRHAERVSFRLVLGALLVIGGAALVIVGQNL